MHNLCRKNFLGRQKMWNWNICVSGAGKQNNQRISVSAENLSFPWKIPDAAALIHGNCSSALYCIALQLIYDTALQIYHFTQTHCTALNRIAIHRKWRVQPKQHLFQIYCKFIASASKTTFPCLWAQPPSALCLASCYLSPSACNLLSVNLLSVSPNCPNQLISDRSDRVHGRIGFSLPSDRRFQFQISEFQAVLMIFEGEVEWFGPNRARTICYPAWTRPWGSWTAPTSVH